MSADHSHVYFSAGGPTDTTYLAGDPPARPSTLADANVYLAKLDSEGDPSLQLLTRDSTDKLWSSGCGARVGGGDRNQGAVSPDGSLTYFSSRPTQPPGDCSNAMINEHKLRILTRSEEGDAIMIAPLVAQPTGDCDRSAPDPPCSTTVGDDLYQGGSLDGSKVYFITNRQLADSDLDSGFACTSLFRAGCDLYLYDADLPEGERLIQVSAGETVPGHEVGKNAQVFNGTVAISSDGSHVYFAAEGILTDDTSPEGKKAQEYAANVPKLYLYERDESHPDGELSFVGALDGGDSGGLYGGNGTFRNRAYPVPAVSDGHILLFQSKAQLAAEDTDGDRLDVYRFDSESDEIECISCSPGSTPAEPDGAPFDVVARSGGSNGTDFAEVNRWASEDGEAIVFKTPQPLLPGDDGEELIDSYLWRGGQLARLPGTADEGGVSGLGDNPVLSHDGSQVAFQTFEPLLPFDGDTTLDVYVAREGGGFHFPEPEPECMVGAASTDERCRSTQVAPPLAPLPPSQLRQGEGNPPRHRPCARSARHAQRLSQRAKHLRRNARRVRGVRRARRLSRKAAQLAKAARRQSRQAKRCRNANRRAEK